MFTRAELFVTLCDEGYSLLQAVRICDLCTGWHSPADVYLALYKFEMEQ